MFVTKDKVEFLKSSLENKIVHQTDSENLDVVISFAMLDFLNKITKFV